MHPLSWSTSRPTTLDAYNIQYTLTMQLIPGCSVVEAGQAGAPLEKIAGWVIYNSLDKK